MSDDQPKLTPQQEVKDKLKQIRASYTRAKKLITEVEKSHVAFTKIKTALLDKENGVDSNYKWLADQRRQIGDILKDANKKLVEIESIASSIQDCVNDITVKYASFSDLSLQVFDDKEGLAAVLSATRKLKASNDKLTEKISKSADEATTKLTDIKLTTEKVATAYTEFLEKKKLIDDEETGILAQLRRATDDANSAQGAKTKAELALVSVTKFKEKSDELVSTIGDSKKTVEGYSEGKSRSHGRYS